MVSEIDQRTTKVIARISTLASKKSSSKKKLCKSQNKIIELVVLSVLFWPIFRRHQKDIKKLTDLKTVIERTTNMDKNASVTLARVIKILGRTTLSVLRIFEVEMKVIKKINNEDHGIFSVKSEHTAAFWQIYSNMAIWVKQKNRDFLKHFF